MQVKRGPGAAPVGINGDRPASAVLWLTVDGQCGRASGGWRHDVKVLAAVAAARNDLQACVR